MKLNVVSRLFLMFFLGLTISGFSFAEDVNWTLYKTKFLTKAGRIVDTGNNDVSHSEGQGYGMIFALSNGDKETFSKLWEWTKSNLGRHDLPLFSWKYTPNSIPHIKDQNNATDGDLLVAWALLEAGNRWHNDNYLNASKRIRNTIINHLVINVDGYYLLLPGLKGFTGDNYVDVNLSYWVMPALKAFTYGPNGDIWQKVIDSGDKILSESQFGIYRLPTDWLRINYDGEIKPSPRWPALFGFDAIRIPLYFYMAGMSKQDSLDAIKLFWDRRKVPAWISTSTGEYANYSLSQGGTEIVDLVSGRRLSQKLDGNSDYYSASLFMLAHIARKVQRLTEFK